jgi:ABC-2 type transport system ATP-binding protein
MYILQTEALCRSFGKLKAVDSLTLAVEPREVFGLLGPNGAGKTTVIKMLTTLLPQTSGRATVGGFDIARDPARVRSIIGYVPQMVSADGTLSGYENLLIFAKLHDVPRTERKTRIMDALHLMDLTDAARRLVRTYSGGMIRRLEIAQSMLHAPKVLFLDEPTIGLDPMSRQAVWERIERLRNEYGTTIFLTTHYMEEAEALCSRLAIMHLGTMRAVGTPSELRKSAGGEGVTLEQAFVHYVGSLSESGDAYRETSRIRRTARRLG